MMSLFVSPPTITKVSFKRGDTHLGVFSLQATLNGVYQGKMEPLVEDGVFGLGTDTAVRRYQADVGLLSDGVAGPATQARLVRSCVTRSGYVLPKGLLEGLVALESEGYIAAVNWKVAGGFDYGYTQRRSYGPPFDASAVRTAAHSLYQVQLAASDLSSYHAKYSVGRNAACPFNAWELAVLHHNWPFAADTYWRAGRLPDPNRIASWVTWTSMTWDGWAHYYVDHATADVVW